MINFPSFQSNEAQVLDSEFLSFPSPAKLNLFLHIVGRKANGYHELETLFQFLDHGDTLEIKATADKSIELLTPITGVNNNDNLIIKAAKLLQQTQQAKQGHCLGAQIKINKILPMGGGLGGGSSNAATVLLALNTLWKVDLTLKQLADLGITLGADVPIFIHGFSAFAQGIGEQLSAVNPPEHWYLISKPNVSISTESIFAAIDLPRNTTKIALSDLNIDSCQNDCQSVVIKRYPEVAKLLDWLIEYAPSRMTGTGACIFSRFSTESEARRIQSILPTEVESFVAKGVNTSPLHRVLKMIKVESPPLD